jgi:hypothetical protein
MIWEGNMKEWRCVTRMQLCRDWISRKAKLSTFD